MAGAAILAIGLAACSSSASSGGGGGGTGGSTGASTGASTGGSYNLAMIADVTGVASAVAGPTVPGAQAAIKTINDAGGVNGHKIDLTVFDTQSNPTAAQAATRQAIASKPSGIINGALSSQLQPSIPLLDSSNIPVISAFTVDSLLFPTPKPWFYTLGSTGGQTGRYYLAEAKSLLGGSLAGKKLALEVQGTPQAQANADALVKLGKTMDANFIVTEQLAVGSTSFASQAQAIASKHPDLVVVIDTQTPVIVPALRSAGYSGPVFAGEGASNEAVFSQINDTNYYADRTLKAATPGDALSAAADKYGLKITGSYFTSGWTMAYILKTALAKCGYPCSDPAKFEAAIDSVGSYTIDGDVTFGPVQFSATRHYGLTKVQFYVWDPSKKMAVASGDPIDDTDGNPPS